MDHGVSNSNSIRGPRNIAFAIGMAATLANVTPAIGQDEPQKPKPSIVRSVSFSPDGKLLAVALEDADKSGKLVVWDVATRTPRFIHHEDSGIRPVAFAPDGSSLAIGLVQPLVKLVDVSTGDIIKTFEGHENQIRSVAYSHDGLRMVTASNDRTVKIWDLVKGECLTTFIGHTDIVTSAVMAPDGDIVVSCGHDGATRLWKPATGEEMQVHKPTQFAVAHVDLSPDGKNFVTAHYDGFARIRETKTGVLRARISTGGGAEYAAFTTDMRTLATITHGAEVQLFDIDLSEPGPDLRRRIQELIGCWDDDDFAVREGASTELVKIGMSAESQLRTAMKSESAEVRIRARRSHAAVWSPQPRSRLTGHTADVTCIACSPSGKLLASGDRAGDVKLWDITTGKNLATLSAIDAAGE
jgi:WD40 repeat protein